jgi:hypothetical protein
MFNSTGPGTDLIHSGAKFISLFTVIHGVCYKDINSHVRGLFGKKSTFILGNQCRSGGGVAHAKYHHMTHCLVNHHITGHLVITLVSTDFFFIWWGGT